MHISGSLEYLNVLINEYNDYDYPIGYDQVPVDSMQGLDIGSQHGSGYGPMDNLPDLASPGDINFDNLDPALGPPGGDNPNLWYDTDV